MTGARQRRILLRALVVATSVVTIGAMSTGTAAALVPPDASGLPTAAVSAHRGAGAKPVYPLPAYSGAGRRVVYSETLMHVWAVGAKGHVVRDWKVSGRPSWPNAGTYHVFSKALWSRSSTIDVGFRWMVRFAHGHTTSIGFHNIPYDSRGRPIQTLKQLGHPVNGGGCVRSADADAHWLYHWAHIGTTVVVLR